MDERSAARTRTQTELENKALKLRAYLEKNPGQDKSRIGSIGQWAMIKGAYELCLEPLSGKWWYLCPHHKIWKPLGLLLHQGVILHSRGLLGVKFYGSGNGKSAQHALDSKDVPMARGKLVLQVGQEMLDAGEAEQLLDLTIEAFTAIKPLADASGSEDAVAQAENQRSQGDFRAAASTMLGLLHHMLQSVRQPEKAAASPHCPQCGASVMEQARFCHQCGSSLAREGA